MPKPLLAALAFLLLIGVLPAGAATETSAVACPDADGRERLSLDGAQATFEAPFAAPLLAATAEFTTSVSGYRRAIWQYQADFAPASAASVVVDVAWGDGASDYDIFVTDADGFEVARSDSINAADQVFAEQASFEAAHCDLFTIAVTNFAGQPLQALDLKITATPLAGKSLACQDGDTAPGCAGKTAGEAPEKVADGRSLYYLGGDPGQGSMIHAQGGAEDVPFRGRLSPQRPTGAQPNSYTAPPVGFTTYRNPFQAFFTTEFEQPRAIVGNVTALVWVSSRTMNQGGTLIAELFADGGGSVGRVEIPGTAVGEAPTAIPLRFPEVNLPEAYDVTLQLSKEPVASSNGTTSSPGNATFTVTYGSVQFPARLTLP